MIKDFEEVKRQLSELADVINTYKSEAVQLRIVELVLQRGGGQIVGDEVAKRARQKPSPRSRREAKSGTQPKRAGRRLGPGAAVDALIADGYFSERRAIGDIQSHLKNAKAVSLELKAIATALQRAVQDETLKRKANADTKQYEYYVPAKA